MPFIKFACLRRKIYLFICYKNNFFFLNIILYIKSIILLKRAFENTTFIKFRRFLSNTNIFWIMYIMAKLKFKSNIFKSFNKSIFLRFLSIRHIPKELYSLSIVLNNEVLTFFPIYRLYRKGFIFYQVKIRLTAIYVCSNIKYWTIFCILISSFLFLIKKILNCVFFGRLQDETMDKIFVECNFAIMLWSDLRHYFQYSFDLPILNPLSATFAKFPS